jgi:hypothetical protein
VGVRKPGGWISVKERYPENSISVLVWCPERQNKYTACWIDGAERHWRHFGGTSWAEVVEEVTHWQPTPVPPPPPLTKKEQIVESIISTVQKVGKFPQWGDDLRPFAKTLAEEIVNDLKEGF